MLAPTMYTDLQTQISIQVDSALRALLSDDILANIVQVQVQFDLHADTFAFLFQRNRDGMKARFTIYREMFYDAEPNTCIAAFKAEPDQLAKLILFLA